MNRNLCVSLFASVVFATIATIPALADACHDRFSELLVHGGPDQGPIRLFITQEIVGGETSTNYHYSDGEDNGMTEMIHPESLPWSLFIGDNMYMSNDKGKSWSFMNSYDAEKSRADMIIALTKDAGEATNVKCGEEDLDGVVHEVVEGNYTSTMSNGAAIYEKTWINPKTGWIVKSFRHLKSSGFESKTTQLVEPAPDFVLPTPE